jgi:3-hydroxyacyl-CoA dehydrogenase/enoyl-CoA hydratase/3-hydroxybutyryl-CoA epimerase
MHAQTLEAIRAMEDGVLRNPLDGDVASVLGWRFPMAFGGVFGFADAIGTAEFARQCAELSSDHGPRFTPPPLLAEMAADDRRFHLT